MKKIFMGFMIGLLISSLGVFAYQMNATQITYEPKDTSWNVKTVKAAIDDIKQNGTVKKVCKLKSGEALTIGSKYECNPSLDGTTKYNFYVLRVDGEAVKLIMERNITDTVLVDGKRTVDWNTAMNFFRSGLGKNLGWKVNVELPRAQDIADAVGNTEWNTAEKDYTGWFCLATKVQDFTGSPFCGDQSSQNYLYDYTRDCANWGCSHSLDSSYAMAYWTGDTINDTNSTATSYARGWRVLRLGTLRFDGLHDKTETGVRPVITINKNQIK